MKFFDNIFDINDIDDYSVSGLNKELTCINIYDAFIRNNKGILVVTSSTYIANLLYQTLLNYTDKVLFFPMDDFLTSEALAISPDLEMTRIETLSNLNQKKIIVTNLMGYLRYLPSKELFKNSFIKLKKNEDYNIKDLIEQFYNIGYKRETIVTKTGEIAVRGFVVDVFPINK